MSQGVECYSCLPKTAWPPDLEGGRLTNPDLKIGICGEHGGHPESIMFCHKIGLNYVSCSSLRVPIARLAVAHAKLGDSKYSSN